MVEAQLAVVMPVHNGLPHLDASIASMLEQTHRDFTFVVLENGSTDGSAERLAQWADEDDRIELHHEGERLGGAVSSDAVVRLTHAPIVARMDADDVSHPERLERQLAVMRERPDASLVATLNSYIDGHGRQIRGRDRWSLAPGRAAMPFPGGSVMFRRAAYDEVGGYRKVDGQWEDLDLCVRLAARGPALVIPEALYRYRFHLASRTTSAAVRVAVRGAEARAESLAPGRARPADPPSTALVELNSLQLWAGARPEHLDELRRAARRCGTKRRLTLLAWARWAQASPSTLRAALRLRSAVRDRLAAPWHRRGEPRAWRPE
jgi:glycosyltransferase involved in cell wall biosynthesis